MFRINFHKEILSLCLQFVFLEETNLWHVHDLKLTLPQKWLQFLTYTHKNL